MVYSLKGEKSPFLKLIPDLIPNNYIFNTLLTNYLN